MRIDEIKDMLPQKPVRMAAVEEPKKSELATGIPRFLHTVVFDYL